MSEQWIDSVLGKPWVKYAAGPDSFDCWGIVRHYYRNVHGISLPNHIGFDVGFFRETSRFSPDDDGVVLCCFANSVPTHVGVRIGNYVIHAAGNQLKSGQVFRHRLSAFRRIYGDVRGYSLDLHQSADC